jgi:prevent-host-death family protein
MCHNGPMRTAGVREARQDLTSLLHDVRRGREVVITERGRPVARLVPVIARQSFPDLSRVRRASGAANPRLSEAVIDEREDRT